MTFDYMTPMIRQEMYRAFECDCDTFRGATSKRERRRMEKAREACDTADDLLVKVMTSGDPPGSKEEAVSRVRQEYITGNPLIGWVLWQIVGSLISRIVFWLWDRYNS